MSDTKTELPPATLAVHTPNGPVASCEDHAKQIQGLMRFLGAHTVAVPYSGDAPCANCANEAKKSAR